MPQGTDETSTTTVLWSVALTFTEHKGEFFWMVHAVLSSWVERFYVSSWGHQKCDYYVALYLKHNCEFAVMLFVNASEITWHTWAALWCCRNRKSFLSLRRCLAVLKRLYIYISVYMHLSLDDTLKCITQKSRGHGYLSTTKLHRIRNSIISYNYFLVQRSSEVSAWSLWEEWKLFLHIWL